jgi:ABC-type transport system involved in multi-copper enzyme maturation permease subunit
MMKEEQKGHDYPKNMTWLLLVDELRGFAVSAVMITMWVGLPVMGLAMYFLLPDALPVDAFGPGKFSMPSSAFLSVSISSIAGTLAAAMVSIEIVNEKNKKVYDLFLIRPVHRGSFLWAKFFAVAVCTSVAVLLAMLSGLLLDWLRGVAIGPLMLESIANSTMSAIGVVMVSTAAGILIGMISRTVLLAAMLVLFVLQYVFLIPALGAFLPIFAQVFPVDWIKVVIYGITLVLSVILMMAASLIFKRMEA